MQRDQAQGSRRHLPCGEVCRRSIIRILYEPIRQRFGINQLLGAIQVSAVLACFCSSPERERHWVTLLLAPCWQRHWSSKNMKMLCCDPLCLLMWSGQQGSHRHPHSVRNAAFMACSLQSAMGFFTSSPYMYEGEWAIFCSWCQRLNLYLFDCKFPGLFTEGLKPDALFSVKINGFSPRVQPKSSPSLSERPLLKDGFPRLNPILNQLTKQF